MKCRMNRTIDVVGLLVCISAFSGSTRGDEIIDAVTRFADTVVEHGRDRYGEKHTPLFVDVLNVDTLKSPELPQGLAGVDGSGVIAAPWGSGPSLTAMIRTSIPGRGRPTHVPPPFLVSGHVTPRISSPVMEATGRASVAP